MRTNIQLCVIGFCAWAHLVYLFEQGLIRMRTTPLVHGSWWSVLVWVLVAWLVFALYRAEERVQAAGTDDPEDEIW